MTLLADWQLPALRVPGIPAPKGSMIPGRRRDGTLFVREDNTGTKGWRAKVAKGALKLRDAAGGTILGPVGVDVTLTLERPATIDPASRPWPSRKASRREYGGGDVDKLARTILDALEDAKLIENDAQVVELTARKCYPDTPGCPDQLDRPGALIRIYPL